MKKKKKYKTSPCKDLKYRMRKKGYEVISRCELVILPADEKQRSLKMEERIVKELGYRIQYRMYDE